MIATLVMVACQPAEEASYDEASCSLDQKWAMRIEDACDAIEAVQTAKFCDCGSEYCDRPDPDVNFECISIEAEYGELDPCPSEDDVAACIFAVTNQKCDQQFWEIMGPCEALTAD
jgi:hypothetical protein